MLQNINHCGIVCVMFTVKKTSQKQFFFALLLFLLCPMSSENQRTKDNAQQLRHK